MHLGLWKTRAVWLFALVLRIFDKLELLPFVLDRAHTTGLQADRFRGSISAFSHPYLPRMQRPGYVAPTVSGIAAEVVAPKCQDVRYLLVINPVTARTSSLKE